MTPVVWRWWRNRERNPAGVIREPRAGPLRETNKAAVQGSNSSFGAYEISSDGSITLNIVGSTFPNWDGTKQKRLAAIKGDEITWTNPTASMGGNTVITLQRAKFAERYPQRDEK